VDRARAVTVAAEIDTETCLGLLGGATFGRVALSVHAMPRIVPVSFTARRGRISLSLRSDTDLADPLSDATVVAFQADGYDDEARRGWSVHVVGRITGSGNGTATIDPSVIEGTWLAP